MNKYSYNELKTLNNFFTNLSVAWFTGGVIGPYFSNIDNFQKFTYTLIGLIGGYFSIKIALEISKTLK